jgi:hypothetical protein
MTTLNKSDNFQASYYNYLEHLRRILRNAKGIKAK